MSGSAKFDNPGAAPVAPAAVPSEKAKGIGTAAN
jgi:hypothetical protein